MEPIEWIVGLVLLFGGYELWNKDGPDENTTATVIEQTVVSDEPLFERERFYKTVDGYYISDLSPKPLIADGCERSFLITDLSVARANDEQIKVTEVEIQCEG
ncbi:hypothetical protein ACJJI4_24015 (plasmid) [Microbulbifer sp. TRSA002]|uniref:hypothetical protein n=1 Tax=Microbulbifer sp. TRSA002 TaxID=3243382 RepID=UPI004039D94A